MAVMGWFGRRREAREREELLARISQGRGALGEAEDRLQWARLEDWSDHADGVVLGEGELVRLVGEGALAAEPLPGAARVTSYSRDPSLLPSVIEPVAVGRIRPGVEEFQVVARGRLVVTDRRVVFLGDLRTFEWWHSEVVGLTFGDSSCIFHLSGREKPVAIGYGERASVPAEGVLTALVAKAQSEAAYEALLRRLKDEVDAAEAEVARLVGQAGSPTE
jgi:hypothetical protein